MVKYVLRRVLQGVVAVWGVTTVVFVLSRAQGDPTYQLLPPGSSEEYADQLRHQLGFDRPLLVQYVEFLREVFTGKFPDSLKAGTGSLHIVLGHLAATTKLSAVAMVIAIVLGIALGFASAVLRGSLWDLPCAALLALGQALPTFWIGLILILIFAVTLEWLPVGGYGGTTSYIMPAFTLSLFTASSIGRMFRSGLLSAQRQEYVRTAEGKGLGPLRVLVRHVAPNSLLPVITVIGLQAGQLLSGAVLTEVVFSWPGVGRLLVDSIKAQDFPVVETSIIILSSIFVIANLLTDLLYIVADPRVRLVGKLNS